MTGPGVPRQAADVGALIPEQPPVDHDHGGAPPAGGADAAGKANGRPLPEAEAFPVPPGMAARMVLAGGPRVRPLPALDVVRFRAPCPACGHDCDWIEEREDTRLRITLNCQCAP